MGFSRRDFVKMGVLGSAALMLPIERVISAATPPRIDRSELPEPFSLPFRVPPTAQPSLQDADTDHYRLDLVQTARQILPGYYTAVWNYRDEAGNLNPTIDATQGRQVRLQVSNLLPDHPQLEYRPPTSLHLHGSPSLPQYDGYASDVTMPGEYKDYYFPNNQEGRTMWYHDHGIHRTAPNVQMGLAAMYRLFDPLERSLPIPHGDYDVPLIVTDAFFDENGQLLYRDDGESGLYGDVILVNGVPWPTMQVERRKYRFRILNASISRGYKFRLSSRERFAVIATDAGLMPQRQWTKTLRQGAAERYEIVIDFAKYEIGDRVVLENLSNRNNTDHPDTDKVMAFDVVSEPSSRADNRHPKVLNPDNEIMNLDESQSVATRTLRLDRQGGEWTINDVTWQDVVNSGFEYVIGNPDPDAVEIWTLINGHGGWHHPLHIHLVDFKILDRNGRPPKKWERGPKDVAYVAEYNTIRVLTKFRHQVGKYMVHCHNLPHEDHDMMVQYEVGSGGPDPIHAAPARPLPAPPL